MSESTVTKPYGSTFSRRSLLRSAASLAVVTTLAGCRPIGAMPTVSTAAATGAAPTVTSTDLQRYAELLIRTGVNVQPRQGLLLRANLAHAPFVRQLVAVAYQANASYVHVMWEDTPSTAAMLTNADISHLELPAFEIALFRQVVDEGWALLALSGEEFPDALAAVDPTVLGLWAEKRAQPLEFYRQAVSADQLQWCVAGAATPAWAEQVFPDKSTQAAVAALWAEILRVTRADQADPAAAWVVHDRMLHSVVDFLTNHQVRSLHFVDPTPGLDGKPVTDLVVELVEGALWEASLARTKAGVQFHPNMPTEEIFTMPHNQRTTGYSRTSRPVSLLGRVVRDAWFRFEAGKVVEFGAAAGEDALTQFFAIDGARQLGEVALVDTTSPIFQSGLLFYDTLFDENAACHLGFGNAYPTTLLGGTTMSQDELATRGANLSTAHEDFMIGTPTMNVTGLCADGREVTILQAGRFVV